MTNTLTKAQGYFPVTLYQDGQEVEYRLFYSTESIAWLEDEYDAPISAVLERLDQRRWGVIGKMVHAGLLHYDEDRTVRETMRMVPLDKMLGILDVVVEAFNFNVPAGEGGDDEKKTTAPVTKGGKK